MRNSSKGIGVVALLSMIVVIGLVVFAGIFVVTRQDALTGKTSPNQASKDAAQADDQAQELGPSQAEIARAPAKTVRFSALPAALQSAVKVEVSRQTPGCLQSGQLVDNTGASIDPKVSYAPIGSAIVGIGCDGGSAALFATDKEDKWIYITSTQDMFNCDTVMANPVPKQLLEIGSPAADCYDTVLNAVVSYDDALKARYY